MKVKTLKEIQDHDTQIKVGKYGINALERSLANATGVESGNGTSNLTYVQFMSCFAMLCYLRAMFTNLKRRGATEVMGKEKSVNPYPVERDDKPYAKALIRMRSLCVSSGYNLCHFRTTVYQI